MRRILSRMTLLVVAVGVGLFGCTGDRLPMEPDVPQALQVPFFSIAPAEGFDVLRRTTPLAEEVSRTETIGPEGGRINLEGVTLVIPSGALTSETEITVTAPAGDAVVFLFGPHGLQFRRPALIRVDVEGTTAEDELEGLASDDDDDEEDDEDDEEDSDDDDDGDGPLNLEAFLGVFFVGDVGQGVEPLEIIETFLSDDQIIFSIDHFSGYAVASG